MRLNLCASLGMVLSVFAASTPVPASAAAATIHNLGALAFRSLVFLALAAAVTLIAPAQAAAVDTEPLNNSQLTADSLPLLLPGTAVSNLARLGGTGGDVDFFQTP